MGKSRGDLMIYRCKKSKSSFEDESDDDTRSIFKQEPVSAKISPVDAE
jgi:hypothetical protein